MNVSCATGTLFGDILGTKWMTELYIGVTMHFCIQQMGKKRKKYLRMCINLGWFIGVCPFWASIITTIKGHPLIQHESTALSQRKLFNPTKPNNDDDNNWH